MDLEKGMYVRTDDGEIGKITHIETETFSEPAYTLDIFSQGMYKGCKWFDGKASHNIIDLIEVGDYVNGFYVEDVKETFVNVATGSNYFQSLSINEEDIKSIVTYQQFESMSYKVGEE